MKNIRLRNLIIGIIVVIIIISLKTVNDYRERNLVDLIKYKSTDFLSLGFTTDGNKVQGNKGYEWFTEDKKPADELLEFLGQYRVKKINEEEFSGNLNKEEIFEFNFTISHSKAKPALVWVFGNKIHILSKGYYKVVNGPVEVEWIRRYNEKYNMADEPVIDEDEKWSRSKHFIKGMRRYE